MKKVALAGMMSVLLMTGVVSESRSFSESNLLVVYNANSADSLEIAQYYQNARGLSNVQLLGLTGLSSSTQLIHSEYESQIMTPVGSYISYLGFLGYDIEGIVLSSGIPDTVTDGVSGNNPQNIGFSSTWASVDSELTVLGSSGSAGAYINPYSYYDPVFNSSNQVVDWVAKDIADRPGHFDRQAYDGMYLVSRIGGRWSKSLSLELIDRALAAEANGIYGTAFIDQSPYVGGSTGWMNVHMGLAYDMAINEFGVPANIESTNGFYTNPPYDFTEDAFFYWGMYDGSNDKYRVDPDVEGTDNDYGHDVYNFIPGSIGAHVISWRAEWFSGMLADGISGTQYPIAEPFTVAYSGPDALLWYYLQGYTFAEATYLSQRILSWQMVMVGDPLMRITYNYPTDAPVSAIPEPATSVMIGIGVVGTVLKKIRK